MDVLHGGRDSRNPKIKVLRATMRSGYRVKVGTDDNQHVVCRVSSPERRPRRGSYPIRLV